MEKNEGIIPIRKRPRMYVGDDHFNREHDQPCVLNRLIQETLCFAVDYAASGACSQMSAEVASDGTVTVRENSPGLCMEPYADHGPLRGVPFAEVMLTMLYACRDQKKNLHLKENCCQNSIVVTNALSSEFVIRNRHKGVCWFQEYRKGNRVAPFREESRTTESGVEIIFKPDTEILGQLQFEPQALATWVLGCGLRAGSVVVEPAAVRLRDIEPMTS